MCVCCLRFLTQVVGRCGSALQCVAERIFHHLHVNVFIMYESVHVIFRQCLYLMDFWSAICYYREQHPWQTVCALFFQAIRDDVAMRRRLKMAETGTQTGINLSCSVYMLHPEVNLFCVRSDLIMIKGG